MLRAQVDQSSESPDRHTNLLQIHKRLVDFIAAHTSLSKATLRLADSIVDFYAPEDDGFAPAVAFQTMAADGTSGLLCAQLQALVQTALHPLARHTAELSEIDALAKACKRKGESEHHYATKVNELNMKLETERREDKRSLLQEKAARNINKLTAARRDRKVASEKLYQLIESSQQSSDACLNPIFASICQFQEASYSHGHLLSSMLLRVVRSRHGIMSLPMATTEVDARELSQSPTRVSNGRPTTAASPVQESDAEGVLVWRDDGGNGGGMGIRGHDGGDDEVHEDDFDTQDEGVGLAGSCGASTALDGTENIDVVEVNGRPLEGSTVEVSNSIPPPSTPPTWIMGGASSSGGSGGGTGSSDTAPPPYEVHMAAVGASSGGGAVTTFSAGNVGTSDLSPAPYSMHVSGGLSGGGSGGGRAAGARMGCPRSAFLEAYLPWGKRRRMAGNLRWKNSGSGRSARQVFCAAEGRALVTYDTESDANAGLSPRSRHVVLGARSLWTGRNTAELEVSIADESELMNLGWNQHHSGGAASFPGLQSRFATLTAPGRHEHARWTQALEETKSWKEDLERDALLEELELSLPFRESALEYVRHNMPDDDRIEDILGVTAARHHPESVLKSSVFDAAAAAFSEAPMASGCFSSPEQPMDVCVASQAVVRPSRPNLIRSGSVRRALGGSAGSSASVRRRGLLSIFDSAKSPRGGGHFTNNQEDASGGFASAGGGNGGGGASRRWGSRRTSGKKKSGSKGGGKRRNRSVSGGRCGSRDSSPLKTLGKSWHGVSTRGRSSGGNGGGGRSVEFWSPRRRHSAADSTGEGMGSVGAGLGTECLGDFVGGGHALCRSRSSPHRRLAATGSAAETSHLESECCSGSINYRDRRTKFSTRERSIILELVQEASGLRRHHHNAAAVGGGGLGATSSAAASATGTETGAESSAPSTPTVRLISGILRAGSRRMDSNRRASSNRRDSQRRDSSRRANSHRGDSSYRRDSSNRRFESGSTLAGGCGDFRCGTWITPGERSILGVPAPAVSEAAVPASGSTGFWYSHGGGDSAAGTVAGEFDAGAGKLGAGGIANEPLILQTWNPNTLPRPSGINPYLARRPTKSTSSCPDSSDSLRAGAGGTAAVAADGNNDGGGANASGPEDERTPASRKVWGVWASKDEMPALPPNKQFVAARKKEPEKDGDGVGKVDVKGDGDKEGVPREEMPVACGTTIMEDIDDSDEASIDAGFSSESCGKEEDASGHGNALEHGRPSSGLFRSRFRRVSIDPDRTNSLTCAAGVDAVRDERRGGEGLREVRVRGDMSVRSLALLYSAGAAR